MARLIVAILLLVLVPLAVFTQSRPRPPSNAQVIANGGLSGVGLTTTITVPTSNPTYDAGTATTLAVSGTEQSDNPLQTCTWVNSLGGSGTATGTTGTPGTHNWSIAIVPLTVGSNVITVTCSSVSGTTGVDVITVTASAVSSGGTACSDAATAGTARYLRAGAGGSNNGTDWTNAWTTLATAHTNVARGQTVCVAGGTYPSQTLNKAASGTQTIKFVHAMTTDHGTSTGWSDAFATQATFTDRMTFGSAYWTFDGQTGDYYTGGISSYGFKFDYSIGGAGFNINGQDHITMKYIDCDGITQTGEFNYSDQAKCGELYNGTTNLTLSHIAMHGCESCLQGGGNTFVVEYCYIYNSRSSSTSFHNNVFFLSASNGGVVRYNHIFDWSAEGIFLTGTDGPDSNIKIYGNTFENFGGEGNFPRCVEIRQDFTYSNVEVYNNTCVNVGTGFQLLQPSTCTNCIVRDNLSANSSNSLTGTTNNNNTDDSNTARFVNLGTRTSVHNLHITGAIAGASLATEFNTDLLGNTRGADGTWDQGAYEFCAGGCTFTRRHEASDALWAFVVSPQWR